MRAIFHHRDTKLMLFTYYDHRSKYNSKCSLRSMFIWRTKKCNKNLCSFSNSTLLL